MRVAVVPAPGSGLASMERTGQLERLFVHLGHYANRFDLAYYTWGNPAEEQTRWEPFQVQTGAILYHARYTSLRSWDVLRCLNLRAAWPALRAQARWGTPFVLSYGADYLALQRIHGRPLWKLRLLQAVALRRAARILVSNLALYVRLQRQYPRARLLHHPNWVDCEQFSPAPEPQRVRGRAQVLYVGRLVKEKNLLALAQAVDTLLNVQLVCVGEGPLKNDLLRMGVQCVGAQPWTSLPHWYRGAHVFALPSLSEGHPKALTEAMACGVPCLVSEAVSEGGDAVLRTDDLVGGLKVLLHEDTVAEFGHKARAYALARWDVRILMPRELDAVAGAAR